MTFAHTASCSPFTSAQFLCLPLSTLLPPLFLLSSLSFIAFPLEEFVSAVERGWSPGIFLSAPAFAPTAPCFSSLCFCVVWFCRACVRHCGVSPSLDTVPDSLRMQVYQLQDVCLQRCRECGCLP